MWYVDCEIDLAAMIQRHRNGSDTDSCEARLDDHPQSTLGKPPIREGNEDEFAPVFVDLIEVSFGGHEERLFNQILPLLKAFFSSCGTHVRHATRCQTSTNEKLWSTKSDTEQNPP